MTERTRVETDWFDEPSPSGSRRQGYVTYVETEDYMVSQLRAYVWKMADSYQPFLYGYPRLTIHECWDGYSEYTITSRWHEVEIDWDGHKHYFESTPEFLRALADVEPACW